MQALFLSHNDQRNWLRKPKAAYTVMSRNEVQVSSRIGFCQPREDCVSMVENRKRRMASSQYPPQAQPTITRERCQLRRLSYLSSKVPKRCTASPAANRPCVKWLPVFHPSIPRLSYTQGFLSRRWSGCLKACQATSG